MTDSAWGPGPFGVSQRSTTSDAATGCVARRSRVRFVSDGAEGGPDRDTRTKMSRGSKSEPVNVGGAKHLFRGIFSGHLPEPAGPPELPGQRIGGGGQSVARPRRAGNGRGPWGGWKGPREEAAGRPGPCALGVTASAAKAASLRGGSCRRIDTAWRRVHPPSAKGSLWTRWAADAWRVTAASFGPPPIGAGVICFRLHPDRQHGFESRRGSNPCRTRSRARRPPAGLDPSRGQGARTIACPSSCLPRRGKRVTKTVAKERDSPVSRGITKSHRVTGNPSILLTRPHGTARQSQLPKLDVAGSIPVAGPTNAGELRTTRSPLRVSDNRNRNRRTRQATGSHGFASSRVGQRGHPNLISPQARR